LKLIEGWGVILISGSLFALDPAKSVFQLNCVSWSRENGLPANGINAITQTKDGFLWVGTQKGLARFDGVEFKPLNLPNESHFRSQIISALSSSRKGGLWFGLRNGSFGFYSGTAGFSTPEGEPWMTPTMNVRAIREAGDGSVWVGSDLVTARWVGGEINQTHSYSDVPGVWTVCEGTGGRVWLGTVEHGLYYWQAGKVTAFPDETLAKDSVTALVEDRLGQLWVGTRMGLRCYNANFQPIAIPRLFAEVKALLVDRNGRLWIGTTGLGLVSFSNGAFVYFQKADGLANENVTALFEDREGTLWIGTRNGLSQLTDVKFPIYSSTDGILAGGAHGVCASRNGGVWAGTTLGLSFFDEKTNVNYGAEAGLSSRYLKLVHEARDGDVYVIDGDKTVEVLSGGKVVARYPNTNWPTAFAEDARSVVVSIGDGLFRATRTGLVPYEPAGPDGLPLYWVRSMYTCGDGSILIASVNGIFRLNRGAVEHWSVQDGLSDNDVLWVCEDPDGVLWAGLTTGIARVRGREVRNITMSDGLHDNFIYAIVFDDLGSAWVNSTRGIFRVSRKNLNDFADGRTNRVGCTAYDSPEAAKMTDTTEVEYSGCKTADGRIWFPSPQGVEMINPNNLFINSISPPVYIEQVRANGCELMGHNRSAPRPGKGNLEFQYTAVSFIAPQKVQFRYRLEGYEPEWVDAGTRRSAFYTNLKPGKYQFHVQACNADGIWNTAGDSFVIQLPPAFYQTAWFNVLCGLLGIAALAGLYAWRVGHLRRKQHKLQKLNELLESKVRERTRELLEVSRQAGMAEVATSVLHNVGNVLNSVNVSASLVEDRIRKSGAANLVKVTALLREHAQDLAGFLTRDEKGKQLVGYLEALDRHIDTEKADLLREMQNLGRNVEHIKEIVAMQQTYDRVAGVTEIVNVSELVEDALRMHALGYERHGVAVCREFSASPAITVDRHKAVRILVNLLQNAKQACDAAGTIHRQITVRIRMSGTKRVKIEIADNGIGIAPEDLTRIFSHGFTTRKNGHGFGLHSGALAAREMGGRLTAKSDGPGKGAAFALELPVEDESCPAGPRDGASLFVIGRRSGS
jgi:signal transduction histidine kinase/streptogramin lyase